MRSPRRSRRALRTPILALLVAVFAVACSDDRLVAPDAQSEPQLNLFDLGPDAQIRELSPATLVLTRNTVRLMNRSGVVATAVGLTEQGRPTIQMYVDDVVLDELPDRVDGIPVTVIRSGPIMALQEAQDRGVLDPQKKCENPPCGKPGGGGDDGGDAFNPREKHRPAPNGVSIGHPDITAGTLGALVTRGGKTYILSNNHVMANENAPNGKFDIYQPGPFDGGTSADVIAQLSDWVVITFSTTANNRVDAAIAELTGTATGATVTYGAPRSSTIAASVGMRVMKYGRTTEQTKGRVQGINATVNVGYDTGVARFVDQIIIGGGGFSAGGDSGSLIVVERGSDAERPVGLLFAGGGGTTVANPIDQVLDALGVTIVGN
jgi:hypothetical protein